MTEKKELRNSILFILQHLGRAKNADTPIGVPGSVFS